MKIVQIHTYLVGNPWKNWLFTKVTTDEGVTGIGEGSLNYFAKTVEAAIHELKYLVIGMNPFQIEVLSQKLIRDLTSEGAQIHMSAVAAIEIACWDIIGKVCGQPIYNLWGGQCHHKLRAYANGWYRGPRTPQSFAEKASRVVKRGYTALKLDPFGSNWRTLPLREFDLSMEIIAAVRDAVGKHVDIMVEGHRRFSPETAFQIAKEIECFRPAWFEEPLDHTNISAMAELARKSPVPIATGESFSNKHQFADLLRQEVISIWQPEPLNLGGIFATRKIADAIDGHYGVVAPHSAQGPVSTAACVQVGASIRNFMIQEVFDDFNEPWEKRLVDYPVEIKEGYITISERP
jgi:galactonate dehydratase